MYNFHMNKWVKVNEVGKKTIINLKAEKNER